MHASHRHRHTCRFGTHHARKRRARGHHTWATTRKSSIRPLVQDPMKTLSILTSCRGVLGSRPMYLRARSMPALRRGSCSLAGSGTLPVMGAVSWGDVPQVTVGEMSLASMITSVSYLAPVRVFQISEWYLAPAFVFFKLVSGTWRLFVFFKLVSGTWRLFVFFKLVSGTWRLRFFWGECCPWRLCVFFTCIPKCCCRPLLAFFKRLLVRLGLLHGFGRWWTPQGEVHQIMLT
jgi:hypothetical protein